MTWRFGRPLSWGLLFLLLVGVDAPEAIADGALSGSAPMRARADAADAPPVSRVRSEARDHSRGTRNTAAGRQAAQPDDNPLRGHPLLEQALTIAGVVLLAPVLWPIFFVSNRILNLNFDFSDPPWPVMVLVLCASLVVWSVVLSRGLHRFGFWNPFWRANGSRPRLLRAWVSLKEWLELRRVGGAPMSRWASFVEVLSCRYAAGDIFLGRPKLAVGGMLKPIGISTEKHMVTIAAPGAGKSTAAVVPNLCLHEGSLLCVDPKGELARITARRRGMGGNGVRGMGQKVFVVDPFRIAGDLPGASYNVFDEMARVASYNPDKPVSYAGRIADALVRPMSDRDTYWDNAAKTFITGLLLYIFTREPEERRNLTRLRQLITEGDVEAYEEALNSGRISPDDRETTPIEILLREMKARRTGLYGSQIAQGADEARKIFSAEGQVISFAAGTMLSMAPNQMGSVLTTAQEHTSFLDIPEIGRISTRSDFLLEDLKCGDVSIYLCMPLGAVGGKEGRWLRMFIMLLIDMMRSVTTAPNPPMLLAIDEFPSLGRLDGIESVAPTLRSSGVRLWVIGQDLEQFKHVYPGTWSGFIGGAEAVQFLGITEPSTVGWLVERLGRHVVLERVRYGKVVQRHETVKPLLDEDQAARLLAKKWGNQIVWRGSAPPLLLKTAPYFKYLPFWYYEPDPRSPHKEPVYRRVLRWMLKGSGNSVPAAPSGVPDSIAILAGEAEAIASGVDRENAGDARGV